MLFAGGFPESVFFIIISIPGNSSNCNGFPFFWYYFAILSFFQTVPPGEGLGAPKVKNPLTFASRQGYNHT